MKNKSRILSALILLAILMLQLSTSSAFAAEEASDSKALENSLQQIKNTEEKPDNVAPDDGKVTPKNTSGTKAETDSLVATDVIYTNKAQIVILNKITTKPYTLNIVTGKRYNFSNISYEIHKCAKSTDPYNLSNKMLVSVYDTKEKKDSSLIFRGWMISTNPSISTIEHPVYELIPIKCID